MRSPRLRDVRLGGVPAVKMNTFIQERMMTPFAQKEIFGEARRAFSDRDDDEKKVGGLWRGEFWGKLMISAARVADYRQDPALLKFVREECHRMIALQDLDGYLGSYADKELVSIRDRVAATRAFGWNTVWNLWNRKYAMWGMLMSWQTTGDPALLHSVEAQMDQWISMMKRLGLPLLATGQPEKVGLPSMSVLKPLLQLYAATGKRAYLEYAREIVSDWDRVDGAAPNFYRNAMKKEPIHTWYPRPNQWAKCYELMSCLDGLLEYYRVTGDRRTLDTVIAIRENIAETEANPLGGVGYCDQFYGAKKRMNAITEVCDSIHWIRLNLDLYLITGKTMYLDAMERCYFNAFLAGVYRSGQWSAFAVRGHARHSYSRQCGYAYNHCCVNNVPRTFMDMASATLTADRDGVVHVNFYQDAEAELDGVKISISGGYPVQNRVSVRVRSVKPTKVAFRHPDWCPQLWMNERGSKGADWVIQEVPAGETVFTLVFDMPARIVDRPLPRDREGEQQNGWFRRRYEVDADGRGDIAKRFRVEPAALLMRGPLLLAKAKRLGTKTDVIFNPFSVNLKGYAVTLSPRVAEGVWGAWDAVFTKPGETPICVPVCDYQSAGDAPLPKDADAFSIWF